MKLLYLIAFLTLVSCGPDLPNGDKLIQEILDARIAEHISQKDKDCRAEALADAEEHVDSIVHKMLNADLVDSLEFPSRPVKPLRPDGIIGKVQKFEVEN